MTGCQFPAYKNRLYLLLQHHNHLGLWVVGAETLDEFWVVKQLHQFDLFAGRCPLLGGPGSVELPRTHLAGLLVAQPKDLTELPATNMRQVMFYVQDWQIGSALDNLKKKNLEKMSYKVLN